MTLDELMESNEGDWEKNIASVRYGMYSIRVAVKERNGTINLTPEGLWTFPGLVLANADDKKKLTK